MVLNHQSIKYNLKVEEYKPLIVGESSELLKHLECCESCFPRTVEVLGGILRIHLQRHPLLEDWLLIPHYQFFWDSNLTALRWFEALFAEAIKLIGASAWWCWVNEIISQTDCSTTHALCDRLYDFFLQLHGAMYLAREGWEVHFIPPNNSEKSPDIRAVRNGQECVLECKFVHTSEKYESFWRRFNTAAFKYVSPRPPPLLCENFRFPSSLKIKNLSTLDCRLLKTFTQKVYETPDLPSIGLFSNGRFIYRAELPAATIPLDLQCQFAQAQGADFAAKYLKRLLDEASNQLNKLEFSKYMKILFIGMQPDALYLAPWNEDVISEIKLSLKVTANLQGIDVIFSEDVGFSARSYV